MTAAEIISRLEAEGFRLRPKDGGKVNVVPAERITDEIKTLILDHKPEILRELRRRQALAMLDADPGLGRAYVVDPDSDPERVLVMFALRGIGTCEIEIPRDRWDPFLFLRFLEGERPQ